MLGLVSANRQVPQWGERLGEGQCCAVPKGVLDDVKDDVRAVFKYLQGFSSWEAAALF